MKYNFDEIIERRNTNNYKWDRVDKDVLPMSVATMDFKSPQPVIDAVMKRAEMGSFDYDIPSPSYNASIINWMKNRHNWCVQEDWLEFSLGTSPVLSMIARTFTQPGDKVIVQTPVYTPFYTVTRNNGRQIVENKLILKDGRYVMDFNDLEEKAKDPGTTLFILCNPHNPVGRVWTREELQRIGQICLENNVLVVSDDVHSDFIYEGYEYTPIASMNEEFAQNTITCHSPSKTFNLGGLFNGFVVIPNKNLREKYSSALATSRFEGNIFGLAAMEASYTYGEDYLEQLLKYIKGNYEFLTEYVEEKISRIKVIKPEGTYVVWLDCRELNMDKVQLSDFMLNKAKVALNEGHEYGEDGEGFMRINIACPKSTLEEGLKRIELAINNL